MSILWFFLGLLIVFVLAGAVMAAFLWRSFSVVDPPVEKTSRLKRLHRAEEVWSLEPVAGDVRFVYDSEIDAIYVRFRNRPVAWSRFVDDSRIVDIGPDGEPVGVEFLDVSQGVNVRGIPESRRIAQTFRKRGIHVTGDTDKQQSEGG